VVAHRWRVARPRRRALLEPRGASGVLTPRTSRPHLVAVGALMTL
jgi:hypothetical protein